MGGERGGRWYKKWGGGGGGGERGQGEDGRGGGEVVGRGRRWEEGKWKKERGRKVGSIYEWLFHPPLLL